MSEIERGVWIKEKTGLFISVGRLSLFHNFYRIALLSLAIWKDGIKNVFKLELIAKSE